MWQNDSPIGLFLRLPVSTGRSIMIDIDSADQ